MQHETTLTYKFKSKYNLSTSKQSYKYTQEMYTYGKFYSCYYITTIINKNLFQVSYTLISLREVSSDFKDLIVCFVTNP